MKILFVTSEIPFPPDNGVRIVAYNAMRLMSEAGHKLALAVLTEESDDNEARFKKAEVLCEKGMAWWMRLPKRSRPDILLHALTFNRPFYVERYRYSPFRRKLKQLTDEFQPDAVHFDLIAMTQYRNAAPDNAVTVASINDCFALALENYLTACNYRGIERIYRTLLYRQTRRYEADTYRKFDVTHIMSVVDEEYLHALSPGIVTAVIPNGAGADLFNITGQTLGMTDIIFIGKLADDYILYLESFLKEGWPIIQRECPEVKLHIVGRIGPQARRLCELAAHMKRIVFEGYVERLADAYKGCGISVVPVNKNCGIINKAIEAMAAGLVAVGFEKTFKAIEHAKVGKHFLSASSYSDLGRTVVDIIRDEPRRLAIQQNAHQLAARYYSWPSRRAAYEKMYRSSAVIEKN